MGLYMLSEALQINLRCLEKIMEQLTSNGSLSLWQSIQLPVLRGRPNLIFCITFEIRFGQTWHGVNHKDPIYHISTSSYHPYTTKGGYGPLKQQWMSLLAEQYPISTAERVPEIWHFTWNLRVLLGRNDTVLTIRRLCMQTESLILICIHLSNDIKHPSSNAGCISL